MNKTRVFLMACLVGLAAQATFAVPYTVDSHTLHLYHFDGNTNDSVTTNPIHLVLDSGATTIDAKLPGLGQALYTYEGTATTNQNLPSAMATPEVAIRNFVGSDGAFTFEALVCPAFGLGAMPNNMQIISGEHNSSRGWQFRVESAGNLIFIKLTGTVQTIATPLPRTGSCLCRKQMVSCRGHLQWPGRYGREPEILLDRDGFEGTCDPSCWAHFE